MQTITSLVSLLQSHKPASCQYAKTTLGKTYLLASVMKVITADLQSNIELADSYLYRLIMDLGKLLDSEQIGLGAIAGVYISGDSQSLKIIEEWAKQRIEEMKDHDGFSSFELTCQPTVQQPLLKEESQANATDISPLQRSQTDIPFFLDISEIPVLPPQPVNSSYCRDLVSQYLNRLPICRSQINLLFQQIKLGNLEYKRDRFNQLYYVHAHAMLRFEGTNFFMQQIYGFGTSANYKHACEQAAWEALWKIYKTFPNVWYSFMQIKSRKGLK